MPESSGSKLTLPEVLGVFNHSHGCNTSVVELLRGLAAWLEEDDDRIHTLLEFSGSHPQKAIIQNGIKR
jgi:hypothetical protein